MPGLEPNQIRYVTIAEAGADNPRNDTASVVEFPDGRLMVAWHKYGASAAKGSDFGVARIYAKDSLDGGLTWARERMLVDVAPGDLNVQAPALCLMPSGEVLLICLRAHARASTTMLLLTSADGGETFRLSRNIWEQSQGQWLQGGASSLMRLSGGRLLAPFHGGKGDQWSQHNVIRCYLSDDQGHSWRLSQGEIDLPMRGAMEASVAELSDGRLVMSIRTQLGSVFVSRSDDGGDTWELAQTSGLKAPESCTCLRRLPGTDDLVLFWNDSTYDPAHHHYGQRSPLSAALSHDGGKHWARLGNIQDGHAEYTNLGCTFTAVGAAILTYMASEPPFAREKMDLRAALIPPEWFRAGEDTCSRGRS